MNGIEQILANVWIGLIAFFLLSYAITDGADLGLGIMSLYYHSEADRSVLMGSIESTWHANQTWLVIVGGMVFGAFPFFYAVVFSALYIPIMAMIFGLILRGVALDYWSHAKNKTLAGWIFAAGSLLVSGMQGFALGGFLGGIHIERGRFAGAVWDWLTPFSGLVTAGVIIGDLMLGASFLILKAQGRLQALGYRYGWITAATLLPISGGVYAWMFLKYPHMVAKITTIPSVYWVAPFPFLTLVAAVLYLFSLWKRYERLPIFFNAALILFAFAGISVALYPYMIPNVVSSPVGIAEAAASLSTLVFMIIVTGVMLPIIIIYSAYNQFWVFRGKIERYLGEVEEDSR